MYALESRIYIPYLNKNGIGILALSPNDAATDSGLSHSEMIIKKYLMLVLLAKWENMNWPIAVEFDRRSRSTAYLHMTHETMPCLLCRKRNQKVNF